MVRRSGVRSPPMAAFVDSECLDGAVGPVTRARVPAALGGGRAGLGAGGRDHALRSVREQFGDCVLGFVADRRLAVAQPQVIERPVVPIGLEQTVEAEQC